MLAYFFNSLKAAPAIKKSFVEGMLPATFTIWCDGAQNSLQLTYDISEKDNFESEEELVVDVLDSVKILINQQCEKECEKGMDNSRMALRMYLELTTRVAHSRPHKLVA